MTVADLIIELQKMPQNAKVWMELDVRGEAGAFIYQVKEVIIDSDGDVCIQYN